MMDPICENGQLGESDWKLGENRLSDLQKKEQLFWQLILVFDIIFFDLQMGIENSKKLSPIHHQTPILYPQSSAPPIQHSYKLQYLEPKHLSDDEEEHENDQDFNQQSPIGYEIDRRKWSPADQKSKQIYVSLHMSIDEEQISVQQKKSIEKKVNWNKFIKIRKQGYINYYNCQEVIGKGAFGEVVEATEKNSGRHCAAKKINKNRIPERKKYKCFLEMDILSKIDHPYIVKLFQVFDHLQRYVMIFQFVDGMDFQQYQRNRIISEKQLICLIKQLLQSISYLHSKGIIHRDIKCENILKVKDKQMIKLIDFGAATYCSSTQKMKFRIGTLPYMAPEVFKRCYGHKCDIWSIGVVLYRLITGKFPFRGKSKHQFLENICGHSVSFKDPLWTNYSPQCISFIKKLLQKNPTYRPTARQCLDLPWLQKHKSSHNIPQQNIIYDQMIKFKFQNALQAVVNTYIVSELMKNHDVSDIIAAFHRLDTNKDGVISVEELESVFCELMYDKSMIPKLMQIIDLNGSGFIDYTQFLIGTINQDKIRTSKHLDQTFHYFDIDQNGLISIDELANFLEGKIQSREQIRKLFDIIDVNKDGLITKQQFFNVLLAKRKETSVKLSLKTTQNDLSSKQILSNSNISQNSRWRDAETEKSYISLPMNQNPVAKHQMPPKTEPKIKEPKSKKKIVRFNN